MGKMRTIFVAMSLVWATDAGAAIMVDVMPATLYNVNTAQMNSDLGITPQYLIEDFEDTSLITGLSVSVENNTGFDVVNPVGSLFWDGQNALANLSGSGADGQDVTFTFPSGAFRFGIGLSVLDNPTYTHQVIVNGGTVLTDEIFLHSNWDEPDFAGELIRNGYIWFTATGGDSISSIKFQTSNPSGDTIYFDHGAVLVPEPSTATLLALGLFGLAATPKRRPGDRA